MREAYELAVRRLARGIKYYTRLNEAALRMLGVSDPVKERRVSQTCVQTDNEAPGMQFRLATQ